jgi:hypothetical protein
MKRRENNNNEKPPKSPKLSLDQTERSNNRGVSEGQQSQLSFQAMGVGINLTYNGWNRVWNMPQGGILIMRDKEKKLSDVVYIAHRGGKIEWNAKEMGIFTGSEQHNQFPVLEVPFDLFEQHRATLDQRNVLPFYDKMHEIMNNKLHNKCYLCQDTFPDVDPDYRVAMAGIPFCRVCYLDHYEFGDDFLERRIREDQEEGGATAPLQNLLRELDRAIGTGTIAFKGPIINIF